MKKLLYLFIILLIAVLSCKKDSKSNNNSTENIEEKLTTNLNALRDAVVVYNDALQQSGDSLAALNSMRTWLANSPDVSGGWFHNIEFLEIEFSNGLKSPINIIPVSNNGEHLRRGGGAAGNLTGFQFKTAESQKIKNKKVLVLIPYPNEFGYSTSVIQNLKATIESGQTDMEADIEVGSNVTLSDLDRLGDYGFTILDVHGVKNGFILAFLKEEYDISDIWFPEDVIADVFNIHSIPADKIANGQIKIGLHINTHKNGDVNFSFNVLITEDYIRHLDVDLSDAVVFGNHCYSGHTADGPSTNNMAEAWRSRNAATYYGYAGVNDYSAPVDNDFCKDMELALIKGLITDGDTTGEAHLKQDGTEYFYVPSYGYNRVMLTTLEPDTSPPTPTPIWPLYFRQYFDKDYEFESCSGDLIDARDGAVYKTVCIGNQVWMAENLKYAGAGVCYDNNSGNCAAFGRLYTIFEATGAQGSSPGTYVQGICPQGWHIPSQDELQELLNLLGGFTYAGDSLKADTLWTGTYSDPYNFQLLPAGYQLGGSYSSLGSQTYMWLSTVNGSIYNAFGAWDNDPRITSKSVLINNPTTNTDHRYSCRCVKD